MHRQLAMARVAIIDGVRTPFAKQRTVYRDLTAVDLGALCVAELLHRTGIDETEIDQVVYGQVVPSLHSTNIGRDLALRCGLPLDLDAYSVSRACTTSYQSIVSAAHGIRCGDIDVAVAGGADSASATPVAISETLRETILKVKDDDSLRHRVRALAALRPADLKPAIPALTEPSTGLTMGESAEKMAKDNHISREEQDDFAHRSHILASRAWKEGKFDDEVMQVYVPPRYEQVVTEDNLVRHDSDRDAYAALRPVFDPDHGTITAGNSSPLSDGASAVLLMSESRANALGLVPLGFVRSHAFAAVDPTDQLLIGPVDATPTALERAGLTLADMDLVDMHEAFSAQMLAVLRAFERDGIGAVDMDRLNVNGGSIALGHPFAATGARQIIQTLNELRRRGGDLALCTACAAGGLAAAIVLEAA